MTSRQRSARRKAVGGFGWLSALVCLAALAAPAQGASGTWDRAWGKDVDSVAAGTGFEICTVAASCQVGSNLTALGGEMNEPSRVATDAAGNVYLADSQNNRIQKFADPPPAPPAGSPAGPTGERAAALKKCKKKKSKKARTKCKKKANKLPV